MQRATPRWSARKRDVDPVGGELRHLGRRPELRAPAVEGRDEIRTDRVDLRADLAAVAVGQGAEGAVRLPGGGFPPGDDHLRGVELVERRCGSERRAAARIFLIERAE